MNRNLTCLHLHLKQKNISESRKIVQIKYHQANIHQL